MLLYIPLNTSAVVCVSATKTTVPSSHGKLLFRAATDRIDQHAPLSTLLFSCSLSQLPQLLLLSDAVYFRFFAVYYSFSALMNFPMWVFTFLSIHRQRPDKYTQHPTETRCTCILYRNLSLWYMINILAVLPSSLQMDSVVWSV